MKTALLLSGGMDSIAIAFWMQPEVAVTIDYGQRAAEAEISASSVVCCDLGIEHLIVRVDCSSLGSGDMAGKIANLYAAESDWWPYRNQMLITLSAMKVISLDVSRLLIGTVRTDQGHKDGTQAFVKAVNAVMMLQEGSLKVLAPAINFTTPELIRKSGVKMDQLGWAHSCHKANTPCCECRGCNKHFEVLQALRHELD